MDSVVKPTSLPDTDIVRNDFSECQTKSSFADGQINASFLLVRLSVLEICVPDETGGNCATLLLANVGIKEKRYETNLCKSLRRSK